jgi:peptide/nickel transport system substrate-binding protein
MADGRSLEIVVETAGEDSEQTDVLELIGETWIKAGIKLFAKPSQRDVVRGRIYSGETLMSVWSGLENGVPSAGMNPQELAPVSQGGLQWPKWGQYHETMGRAGEKIDLAAAQELFQLNDQWREAATLAARETIWRRMLQIHAEQQFSIGVIGGIYQPVVINKKLRNVPEEAIYNWEPGAFFGVHRPDLFWFDR